MAYVSKLLNAVKDGYLKAIGWVAEHPHKSFWSAVAALVVALVF